jgi:hypothetical protein
MTDVVKVVTCFSEIAKDLVLEIEDPSRHEGAAGFPGLV